MLSKWWNCLVPFLLSTWSLPKLISDPPDTITSYPLFHFGVHPGELSFFLKVCCQPTSSPTGQRLSSVSVSMHCSMKRQGALFVLVFGWEHQVHCRFTPRIKIRKYSFIHMDGERQTKSKMPVPRARQKDLVQNWRIWLLNPVFRKLNHHRAAPYTPSFQ